MILVFINEWPIEGKINVYRDSNPSTPIFSWNYDHQNAYGENLCGISKMDYVLVVEGIA